MNLLSVLLMTQPQGGEEANPYSSYIMMALLIGVFYFFFIRPQQKKAKETKEFRASLSKGDKVVSIGGIHGKIMEITDAYVIIETEGQGRLKLNKDAVNPAGEATAMAQQK